MAVRQRRSSHEIYQKYCRKYPSLKKSSRNSYMTYKKPSVGDIYTDGTYLIQITNTDNPQVIGKYIYIINPDNTNLTENDIKGHPIYFFPESESNMYQPYYGNTQCENTRVKFKNNDYSHSKRKKKNNNHNENPQCDF
tara:strand:- start:662 stop:1075 length:414 start_codon:yes stop_codon:yes gene_type:complete